uniref:Uncharacterized protein n=1 Tax=Chelonoidis abingdonii TaxID=106734 RepID=A0A8C0JEF0_CHEAB
MLLFTIGALLLLVPASFAAHAGWGRSPTNLETNTYEALKISFAQEFNFSNCWICSQIPHHAAGLPWRAVPQNWSDICQVWLSINGSQYPPPIPKIAPGWPTRAANCSKEAQFSLTNYPWEPIWNGEVTPQPISLRAVPPGLLCCAQNRTANHTWFAGNSTCQYYLTPTTNVSIPVYNSSGQDSGEGFIYWTSAKAAQMARGDNGLLGNGLLYYICGQNPYKWLPHGWYGSCYQGFLAPPLQRRSLYATPEPVSEGDRLGMILLPSYGVGRLAQLYRRLSVFLTKFANETLAIEKGISSELYQLRLLSLQNRQALDYVLASQGGVCALIGSECCTYVPENAEDINKHILSAEQALKDWLPNLGGIGGGLVRLLLTGVILCIVTLILIACIKMLLHKLCNPRSPKLPMYPVIESPSSIAFNQFLSADQKETETEQEFCHCS